MVQFTVLTLGLVSVLAPVRAFIGMSIEMYKPPCAHACRDMIASAMLDCPEITEEHHDDMQMEMRRDLPSALVKRHGDMDMATPACRAQSLPFLTSLAYCIDTRCEGVPASKIEKFWEETAAGGVMYHPTTPHYSYAEALMRVNGTPTQMYDAEATVTGTVLTDETEWYDDMRTIDNFAKIEATHALYAVIALSIGLGMPIVATLVTLLIPGIMLKLKPHFTYPAFFTKHNRLIWRWFTMPTYGQAIYIGLFFLANIILTGINISSIQPSTWYANVQQEVASYIANRTGIIAMALAPLTILFAGRNNILLWLTNWNHGTYLLLHRWIARIFTLHVVIHSVGYLGVYVANGSYAENLPQAYWVWGCVATVGCVAMCIQSIFRSWRYEFFLVLHIVLAVFVLAGTWYHLIYRFEYRWGYHWMMYACFAVWGFDRFIRLVLLARHGRLSARLTPLGNITRVDLEGVRWSNPGQHGYAYFPAARKWAPWESHPFSVIPSHLLAPSPGSSSSSSEGHSTPKTELPAVPTLLSSAPRGITFYIKSHSGLTRALHALATSAGHTTALIEGPYGLTSVPSCDRLVLIAGGVGITAILPYLAYHPNAKLHWSAKEHTRALVKDITGSTALEGKEHNVKVGGRFDMREVIRAEGSRRGEVVGVVVCGPAGMCDDARQAVVELGQRGKKIDLRIEAFSW